MRPPRGHLLRRRDVLRLGAAGALGWLSGCPEPARRRLPLPEVVLHGQDVSLGHRLREARAGTPAREVEHDVLVVGAGVAGLSCAWRLRREGLSPRVLDLGREPGGNARSGRNEVSAYPWGAHYLRAPTREHPALETFLREVGVLRGVDARGQLDWDTRAVCAAPLERCFQGGVWSEGLLPPGHGAEDGAELARFAEQVEALSRAQGADGRRVFSLPLERSSRDPEWLALDRQSFAAWLDAEGYTRPAVRWYFDYACRDDYGCTAASTSAWAGLHYFCARHTEDPTRDVSLTWPEGNGRLVRLLFEAQGGTDFAGRALCVGLEPGAPGEPSAATLYHAEEGALVRHRARHLVWAGPRFQLARLLPEPPPGVESFSYSPWLVVNVTLAQPPGGYGAPLSWDNVPYDSPSLGYVLATRDARPGQPCVVTWYRPFFELEPPQAREALLALDEAAIRERVCADLFGMHPTLEGQVLGLDAWRWGHALVRPTPGFLWGEARQAATEPLGSLVCANSDQSGLPLFEEAFYRGVAAGEQVLAASGREVTSLLG
ncbi:MAG: FAD-dependent oxidoreductase [Planctomycetota bacterium]